MSKLNGNFIASAKQYNGSKENPATADSNGLMPVLLNVISGTCPTKRILSGTAAKNAGLTVGQTYIISVSEGDVDPEYGRQFDFNAIKEMSVMDIIEHGTAFGPAKLVEVDAPVEATVN